MVKKKAKPADDQPEEFMLLLRRQEVKDIRTALHVCLAESHAFVKRQGDPRAVASELKAIERMETLLSVLPKIGKENRHHGK